MSDTPNHGYNVPDEGDENWHVPLNENFERHDTDIELRGTGPPDDGYDPKAGAKYLDTDHGVVYTADGTEWAAAFVQGRYTPPDDEMNAGNVVFGHPVNAARDTSGATISGGGANFDGDGSFSNEVTANYGTIGGGGNNTVSGVSATVAGGNDHTASGDLATVGGGSGNTASGSDATVAGGDGNAASGSRATVGGGEKNDAGNSHATVGGGIRNTASGAESTVPGGGDNVASGGYSLAAGRKAKANHEGTLVWADSTNAEFSSTGADQFLIEASGGVGINQNDPATPLHVSRHSDDDGGDVPGAYAALVEMTPDQNLGEVLGLRIGNTGDPGTDTHFVGFFDGNDDLLGKIAGDGSGGVTFTSSGSDYAEFLPRLDPDEEIEPADVVGVVGGAVTRRTGEADRALVVSERAVVTGNSPGPGRGREDHETVAFVGQVPVKVRGRVDEGDLVVPSGEHDGTARALAPAEWSPGDGPLVGRAWDATDDEGVDEVTVAVGLETGEVVASTLGRLRETADELAAENDRKDERIEALERETADLRAENAELRERLAAVEAHVGARPAVPDGGGPGEAGGTCEADDTVSPEPDR